MCGIAGIMNLSDRPPVDKESLARMISTLRHRGPDGYGFHVDGRIGLAHARLSIIDLEGGWQPIFNEDETLVVIFNGEIFNYLELRRDLENRGHRFSTHSDTEVILHLYEERAEGCLDELNGQFAIALYDTRDRSLFLARDRMGIRPLFYTVHDGRFYFGSEVKAIFAAASSIPREIDPEAIREVFTFWMPTGAKTSFRGVLQLGPGEWTRVRAGDTDVRPRSYWDVPFGEQGCVPCRSEEDWTEGLRELLVDSVRLQLRADVPVGAYLSGGLDSSAVTAAVRRHTSNQLETFSIAFADPVYDETEYQQAVASHLATSHHAIRCGYRDVADAFPEVIWHTETPVVRTAPVPLFLLSRLVRERGYKVVLTGEGADEVLGGYDIFKEAKIRAFVKAQPDSSFRALLFKRLYPYLALSPTRSAEYARRFFDIEAPLDDPFFSHRPRWKTTSGTWVFLSDEVRGAPGPDPVEALEASLGPRLRGLDYFSRAQYLESRLLLPNYLLCSQGDRMAMAHSVEGRFPFLDHRLVQFACSAPPKLRMKGLREKNLLKRAMADLLPAAVVNRTKQPYMAPDILSFFGDGVPEYVEERLSEGAIRRAGFFRADAVEKLVDKCRKGKRQGFKENMALVGILSTQLLWERFVERFRVESSGPWPEGSMGGAVPPRRGKEDGR